MSALTEASTPRERRDALLALRDVEAPIDLAAVAAAFDNVDAGVRADALGVLAARGAAGPLIERALADPAVEVRMAALHAIERVELAPPDALLWARNDPEPAVRALALTVLARAREADLEPLLAALRDSALEVRVAAVRALSLRPEPRARAALRRAFDDALPELRVELLDALARRGAEADATLLELALSDSDDQVVLAALRGLARLGKPASAEVRALASSPSPAVATAARALARRESPERRAARARERWLLPLERTAREATEEQHERLLEELEAAVPEGEELATAPLLDWLARAPARLHRRIAELALRAGGEVHAPYLSAAFAGATRELERTLLELLARSRGAARLPAVRRALASRDTGVREAAITAASRTLDDQALPALIAALPEAPPVLRASLLEVLSRGLSPTSAVDRTSLRTLLRELERELEGTLRERALSVRILGNLRDERAREAVVRAHRDRDRGVRIAALRAGVRDRSLEARALRARAQRDGDAHVASTAYVAASVAGDPIAAPDPRALVRWSWPLGPALAFAHDYAGAELCALLESGEPVTRANALARLAREPENGCADVRGLALLHRSASFPVRYAAARWARARRDERPEHALFARAIARCASEERDWRVRSICTGREVRAMVVPPSHSPRALVLRDGRVLIAAPDAAENVTCNGLEVIASISAWVDRYGKE